ncbi:hypothetical protein KFU94_50815 [Chloroflexi bacterium TSY]|nr:hypothetical protein [Chloroflexi bacterium TSY]
MGMTDEARKGLLLETEIIGVGGQCAGDFADCYQRTVNQLEARVVVEADETTSGQPIAYAFVKQTDSFVHEQTAVPVHLRQRFQQDEYGNQTEHFNYGKVCDNGTAEGDVFCGDDELLTYTEFIYEATRYLFNRPMTVRQTDAAGNFVSETHLYYDGEEYVGLPLGQLTRGNLTRETQNLGPNDGHRVIPTKRQAFDEFGNVVGMMDGNGSRVTVERLHLADGQALTYAATYHHGFGTPLSATDYNGNAHAFAYDTFGRLAKVAQPGDTLALPTEQYRYEIGNPHSAIWTEKRECSGQEGMITSVAYFDGLGRKLQVRSEATDGQVVVTEAVTFNARRSIRNSFCPIWCRF